LGKSGFGKYHPTKYYGKANDVFGIHLELFGSNAGATNVLQGIEWATSKY
jgi:hypothetical protein